jgi:hypothetical protein
MLRHIVAVAIVIYSIVTATKTFAENDDELWKQYLVVFPKTLWKIFRHSSTLRIAHYEAQTHDSAINTYRCFTYDEGAQFGKRKL